MPADDLPEAAERVAKAITTNLAPIDANVRLGLLERAYAGTRPGADRRNHPPPSIDGPDPHPARRGT